MIELVRVIFSFPEYFLYAISQIYHDYYTGYNAEAYSEEIEKLNKAVQFISEDEYQSIEEVNEMIDEIDYDGDDYLNTWATYDVGAEFAFTGYESGIVQLEDTVSYDTADMAFNSDGETIYLYSNYTGWYFDYFARV